MADSIVVGTDGSETAKRAVAEAARFAQALGGELHVVTAFEARRGTQIKAPEGAVKVWESMPDSQVESTLCEAATAVRTDGLEVSTHAVEGEPGEALLSVAEEVGASMIVVGNRGMHGARRFVLGSVPNTVSHRASCNVLIVATGE